MISLYSFPNSRSLRAAWTLEELGLEYQCHHVALDKGEGQIEASLVKLLSCRAAEWVTRDALQLFGGMGYAEESNVSRYFVDARVLSIFEGAEETLAIRVLGKSLLGEH